jgi:hypothetical protein
VFIKNHAFMVTPVVQAFWNKEGHPGLNISEPRSTQLRHGTNPTIFSDNEMLSWQPIVLIRNPIAVYESWLRAEGKPYPRLDTGFSIIYTTMQFQRRIFDWYRQVFQDGTTGLFPIIIDADDLLEDHESVVKLCNILGMNSEELVFHWRIDRYLRTIRSSTGVDRSKISKGFDLEKKEEEWTQEFGQVEASILARRVKESWSDYEYLRGFRL